MMTNSEQCYHCGEVVPGHLDCAVMIEGVAQPMCCPGCQAVAQLIVDGGMVDYYRFRESLAQTQYDKPELTLKQLGLIAEDEQQTFVRDCKQGEQAEVHLIISGISCPACVWLLEKHFSQQPGILSISVNLSNHQARIRWDKRQQSLEEILQAIIRLGYTPYPYQAKKQRQLEKLEYQTGMRRLGVAGLGMMQVMMLAVALYLGDYYGMDEAYREFFRWVSLLLTTPILFYVGRPFFSNAWRGITALRLNMDVPISLALISAYFASIYAVLTKAGDVYFDSIAMFVFFITVARFVELNVRIKNGEVLTMLQQILPASVLKRSGESIIEVLLTELVPGDVVVVKPGMTIPADGVVLEGVSTVSEAMMTGESMPKLKQVKDMVLAGAHNVESTLLIQVVRLGDQTKLAGIIALIEQAQTDKPPLVTLTNQVASYFVLAILLIAAFTGLYWYMVAPERALWIVLSVLVVSCPCALSLATPTVLVAANGFLAKQGCLVTRAHVLEALAKITHVVFDKTGTLTTGQFKLWQTVMFRDEFEQDDVVALAAAMEQYSEHPLAAAFLHAASVKQLNLPELAAVRNYPGQGLSVTWGRRSLRLGKLAFVAEICSDVQEDIGLPDYTGSWVLLGDEGGLIAGFCLQDQLREQAAHAIQLLKKQSLQVSVLSGDVTAAVDEIAHALPVDHAVSQATPRDKLDYVRRLQQQGDCVLMVGDGLNDAPVLAQADIAVNMGTGSDFNATQVGVILLNNHLLLLPVMRLCALRAKKIIKQNLMWALLYNLIAIPLASLGWVPPYLAALGMSLSSLLVVLNARRAGKSNFIEKVYE